jgi:hypothetical protein
MLKTLLTLALTTLLYARYALGGLSVDPWWEATLDAASLLGR